VRLPSRGCKRRLQGRALLQPKPGIFLTKGFRWDRAQRGTNIWKIKEKPMAEKMIKNCKTSRKDRAILALLEHPTMEKAAEAVGAHIPPRYGVARAHERRLGPTIGTDGTITWDSFCYLRELRLFGQDPEKPSLAR
jgi:hypothetical protein